MIEYAMMIFGIYFNPFTREFWGLQSDKPFVIKTADGFLGYNSLAEAELAKKADEDIFQFHKNGWHKILFVTLSLR